MLELEDYKKRIAQLSEEELKHRDLYLKGLADGTIQGPLTGVPSIDKVWLKYHSDEAIMCDIPKKTLYENLWDNSKENLDEIAIIYNGRKITYRNMFDKIDETAKSLKMYGLNPGDTITLLSITIPEAIYLFYAANKIGVTVNLLDPRTNKPRIREMCEETNSKFVFVIENYGMKIKEALNGYDCKIFDLSAINSLPTYLKPIANIKNKKGPNISWSEFIKQGEHLTTLTPVEFDINHTATIDYTGGTTGVPKGAKLSDYNMNAICVQYQYLNVGIKRGQKMLNIMPMFLAYGINMLNMSLNVGVTNVLIPTFKPDELDKYLIKCKPEHFMGVPIHFEYLLKSKKIKDKDLSFWITPAAGGDSTALVIEQKMLDFLREHNCLVFYMKGYGLTEMSSAVATTTKNANALGSVGIPLVKNNIVIKDPKTGKECEYGDNGEICIYGPSMMQGYLNNEEETKEAIVEDESGQKFLHSGDIGNISDEGLMYVKDRQKRVIIRPDGHNVFPSTIENVIRRHPAVKNCAVIKTSPDESISGNWAKAIVVLKDEFIGNEKEIEDQLRDLCLDCLPERDVAQFYGFKDSLPYTPAGKIDILKLEQEEALAKKTQKLVRKR